MFDVSTDLPLMLAGEDDEVTCVWAGCDPYNTTAVCGVGPGGDLQNCGRTNKAGVDWQKAGSYGQERYMVLYHTPQEHGGCAGCPILPHVPRPMPRHRYQRRLAESQQLLCRVEGFIHVHRIADALRGQPPPSLAPHRKELEDQFLAQIAAGQRGSVVVRPTATTLTMERANDPRRCLPVSQKARSLRTE